MSSFVVSYLHFYPFTQAEMEPFCLNDLFYIKIGFSIFILTSITYCLHFVDVIVVNDVIECGVELVEEVYNLVRSTGTRQLSEANNVTVPEEQQGFSQQLKM